MPITSIVSITHHQGSENLPKPSTGLQDKETGLRPPALAGECRNGTGEKRPAGLTGGGLGTRRGSVYRQLYMEGRAPAGLALRPNLAARPLDGFARQGEPDAGTGVVVCTMQALEHGEDL